MADKDKQPELTPWQQEHAEFQKKQAEAAAQKAKAEKRKKQPEKVASVIEKYDAKPIDASAKKQRSGFFARLKFAPKSKEVNRGEIGDVLGKIWPFILVTLLILFGSLYVISPLSEIGAFTTTGNIHETPEQIAAVTGIKTNDHVWQILKKETNLSDKIEKAFPRIQTAKITWQFPNTFKAKITEYSESLYLKTGGTYQLVLSNGAILTQEQVDPQKLVGYPVLEGLDAKAVKTFVLAYEKLPQKIKSQISTVTKVPTKVTPDFLALDMKDGHQVRVPLSQMAEKLPYYTSIAAQLTEPSVIDMEAGIYAKSKDAYQQDLDDEKEKEKEKAEADAKAKADNTTPSDAGNTTQDTSSETDSQ